jgi:asparagine synthetase B (glutamine-hydrolysing)
MFAFAFYDAQDDTLLVARDRFGMKPMYYCETDAFVASRRKSKRFRPWLPFEAEPYSISSYLLGLAGRRKDSRSTRASRRSVRGIRHLAARAHLTSVDTLPRSRSSWTATRIQELRVRLRGSSWIGWNSSSSRASSATVRRRAGRSVLQRRRRFLADRGDGGEGPTTSPSSTPTSSDRGASTRRRARSASI